MIWKILGVLIISYLAYKKFKDSAKSNEEKQKQLYECNINRRADTFSYFIVRILLNYLLKKHPEDLGTFKGLYLSPDFKIDNSKSPYLFGCVIIWNNLKFSIVFRSNMELHLANSPKYEGEDILFDSGELSNFSMFFNEEEVFKGRLKVNYNEISDFYEVWELERHFRVLEMQEIGDFHNYVENSLNNLRESKRKEDDNFAKAIEDEDKLRVDNLFKK